MFSTFGSSNSFARGRVWVGALAVTLLFAAAGCGDDTDDGAAPVDEAPAEDSGTTTDASGQSGDDDLDALIEAAQEEGELTFYGNPGPPVPQELAERFEEKYGISVTVYRANSSDMMTRFMGEVDAGVTAADIMLIANRDFAVDVVDQGIMIPLNEADIPGFEETIAQFPDAYVEEDGRLVANSMIILSLAYNTDLIDEADLPSSWEELLDPRFEGEILAATPAGSSAVLSFFAMLREEEEYGDEFLTELADQGIRWFDGALPMAESAAAGEGSVAFPVAPSTFQGTIDAGAPLGLEILEPTTGLAFYVLPVADAPHPNAARLFAHFLLSEEGAALTAQAPGEISPYGEEGEEFPARFVSADPAWLEQLEEIEALLGL